MRFRRRRIGRGRRVFGKRRSSFKRRRSGSRGPMRIGFRM